MIYKCITVCVEKKKILLSAHSERISVINCISSVKYHNINGKVFNKLLYIYSYAELMNSLHVLRHKLGLTGVVNSYVPICIVLIL